jgi:hypothetical protein
MRPAAAYRAGVSTCSATRCQAAPVAAKRAGAESALLVIAVMPVLSRLTRNRYEAGTAAVLPRPPTLLLIRMRRGEGEVDRRAPE